MSINLENIKLLAFIVLFKKHRRNSLFYKNEKKYLTAKKLNISVNTFSKYLIRLEELGLITKHSGCLKFAKLKTCIEILLGKKDKEMKAFKYVRFKAGVNYKKVSFKEIYERIRFVIFGQNVSNQEYHIGLIKKAKEIISRNRINKAKMEFLKSMYKKLGLKSVWSLSNFEMKDSAVSGKYHCAKIIGCSDSTGLRCLRLWNKKKLISREVIFKKISHSISFPAYDELKKVYSNVIVDYSNNTFRTCLGSKVKIV